MTPRCQYESYTHAFSWMLVDSFVDEAHVSFVDIRPAARSTSPPNGERGRWRVSAIG